MIKKQDITVPEEDEVGAILFAKTRQTLVLLMIYKLNSYHKIQCCSKTQILETGIVISGKSFDDFILT